MNDQEKLNTVTIQTEYSRRFPDPLNNSTEGDPLNIEHHIMLSRAIDMPEDISKAPNPREQQTDKGIYKDIRESLDNGADLTFHLKNKGLTILARHVEYSPDKKCAVIYLGEKDGIADGAHTYEIIRQSKSAKANNQSPLRRPFLPGPARARSQSLALPPASRGWRSSEKSAAARGNVEP